MLPKVVYLDVHDLLAKQKDVRSFRPCPSCSAEPALTRPLPPWVQLILNKIRQISKSHVVHAGLPAFRRSSPPPRAPRPPKPKPADPVPMGGDDDVQIIDDPSQKPLDASEEDEEEPPGEEWWVQPGDVPGLKESGWTREMDEMCVALSAHTEVSTRADLFLPGTARVDRFGALSTPSWSTSCPTCRTRPRLGPSLSPSTKTRYSTTTSSSRSPWVSLLLPDRCRPLSLTCAPCSRASDLSTMEYKLDSNLYPTLDDFIADASLIYNNCRAYNPPDSTFVLRLFVAARRSCCLPTEALLIRLDRYVKNANKLEKYMKERGVSRPHADAPSRSS